MQARVLIIAGSDSGGGAGIQADIKTVTVLGGYAMTAITALTAQDTVAVHEVLSIPPAFIKRQIDVVLDDIGADVIKIGMLADADVIKAVADALAEKAADIPVILDPVMVATSGGRLLEASATDTLVKRLFPGAALVTPNIPEAEYLTGMQITTPDDMRKAAAMLLEPGPKAVLLKGGHLEGDVLTDLLLTPEYSRAFESHRIPGTNIHGTGCTLASAIAAGLAQGMVLEDSVERARLYVYKAIQSAPGLGKGHGPLNHMANYSESKP